MPGWIYGWATEIANAADNQDKLIIAYVLTAHDHADKVIVYAGLLFDMVLNRDGCIKRITLWDCERYLADLKTGLDDKTLPAPSSRFPFLVIDSGQFRNVAFEIVDLNVSDEADVAE